MTCEPLSEDGRETPSCMPLIQNELFSHVRRGSTLVLVLVPNMVLCASLMLMCLLGEQQRSDEDENAVDDAADGTKEQAEAKQTPAAAATKAAHPMQGRARSAKFEELRQVTSMD